MIRRVFTLVNVTTLTLSITGVLYISNAHAAAFQLKENSAKALGRSFAGAASAKTTPPSLSTTLPACANSTDDNSRSI